MLRAIFLLLLLSCVIAPAMAACPPGDFTLKQLTDIKQNNWKIADPQLRQKTALALLDCLADPDPILRDEIAFEALSAWMRADELDKTTTQTIFKTLLPELLAAPDANGFIQPFAALTLAEIARVDRIKPFLSSKERHQLVSAAAEYLSQLRDYRGFDQTSGWRHGVAHSADLMLQLSLNPALTRAQHDEMLTAIAAQVATTHHFFQYGEGKRLMAPVFYLGRRGSLNASEWDAWFSALVEPVEKPAATTQLLLAKTHNLQAFLFSLYFSLQESGDKDQKENMLPAVIKALKKLP
jgi:hypothetical protein